jgi:hypothetical protein
MRRIGTLLLAATLLVSCKDSTSPDSAGTGAFAITVGAGTKPTYTWNGAAAHSISVMRTSAQTTIVWGVAAPLNPVLTSPVVHGTVPNGAVNSANTEPTLTAGVTYRVSITLQDTKTAWKDFTP